MKDIKQQDEDDPLNCESGSESEPDLEVERPKKVQKKRREGTKLSTGRAETLEDVDVQFSKPESDKDSEHDIPRPSKKKAKKRRDTTTDSLRKLSTRAEKMLDIGMEAAKMHMVFLKQSAKAQGLDLSATSSDTE